MSLNITLELEEKFLELNVIIMSFSNIDFLNKTKHTHGILLFRNKKLKGNMNLSTGHKNLKHEYF